MPTIPLPRRRVWLLAAAGLAVRWPALADAPKPFRTRGTIDEVGPASMKLTSRTGEKMTVALTPDTTVVAIVPTKLEEIKPGSFIGTAAMPQADGTQRALEVHVFPESMRGTGEGHRPFDLQPQSTMTNGTVGAVTGTTGKTLTVTYQGGEKTITVPPGTPIVTYEPATRAMLAAGGHVILFGTQADDGSITATRISVGKNGLVPPM
jgi:Domain of unknown function (DUF5666)